MNNIELIKLSKDSNTIELQIFWDVVVVFYNDLNAEGLHSSHSVHFKYENLKNIVSGNPKEIQRVILDFVKSVLKPYNCSIILEDYICASIWRKFEAYLEKKVT